MRQLFLLATFLIAPLVSAQELHTFSHGEVADAEKINENFQYVLGNATGSGGCSAEQDGSSVVITCADGTSGVLASEGTVVIVPQGELGEATDASTYPSGGFVVVDANDVVLASTTDASGPDFVVQIDSDPSFYAMIINDESTGTVKLEPRNSSLIQVGYISDDCSGDVITMSYSGGSRPYLHYAPDIGFAVPGEDLGEQLFKSQPATYKFWPDDLEVSGCKEISIIRRAFTLVPYQAASELLEAVYPVRVKQLP